MSSKRSSLVRPEGSWIKELLRPGERLAARTFVILDVGLQVELGGV